MITTSSILDGPEVEDPPQLVLPTGWVVDPLTVARLRWQLERAPVAVRAVVAPSGPLRSGASVRTQTEHLSTQPRGHLTEVRHPTWSGAALVRAGLRTATTDDEVEIDLGDGSILIDHGTFTFDPRSPATELTDASSWSRSPFPWRPRLVFVAGGLDVDRLAWAGGLVDQLLAFDVEARLAVRAAGDRPDGSPSSDAPSLAGPAGTAPPTRLTRVCTASAASLAALGPDVVVALDPTALEGSAAGPVEPSCWRLEYTDAPPALVLDLELDAASRRPDRDGRLGPAATAEALASATRRLSALPRPLRRRPDEPDDTAGPAAVPAPRRRARSAAVRRSIAVVAGPLDDVGRRRVEGLVGHLRRSGDEVTTEDGRDADALADRAADVDLVIVHGAAAVGQLGELVDRRDAAGRATIVDVTAADLTVESRPRVDDPSHDPSAATAPSAGGAGSPVPGAASDDLGIELAPATITAFARATGATTPSRVLAARLEATGVAVFLLPTLHGPDGWASVAAARSTGPAPVLEATAADTSARTVAGVHPPGPPPAVRVVIGWDVGSAGANAVGAAVGAALSELLARRSDLGIEVAGDPTLVPDALFDHDRCALATPDVTAAARGRWALQVWTPSRSQVELDGDRWPLVRAGRAGVPTIVDRWVAERTAVVEAELVAEPALTPDGWRRAIEAQLDDEAGRRRLAELTAARAAAVFGPAAGFRQLDHLFDWISTLTGRNPA